MERFDVYKEKFSLSYGTVAKWLLIGLVVGAAVGLLGLAESGLTIDGVRIWQIMRP